MAVFNEPALISKSIQDLNVGFNNDVFVMFTTIFRDKFSKKTS